MNHKVTKSRTLDPAHRIQCMSCRANQAVVRVTVRLSEAGIINLCLCSQCSGLDVEQILGNHFLNGRG